MSKWEWKKLGDLYPIVMGKTPPRGDPSCWDKSKRTNNVWVTIADISSNENQVITESKEYISDKATKNISLVSPKSLLLSFKLSIGKMAFAGVPLYTNEAIVNFPPIKDIDLHYLHKYFLYYNWDKASEGDTKVKGKTLNKEKLKNIDIPIPPLSEQKRIVKFLDEEFSKIETLKTNAETNLKNAKELFETTLEKELNPLSRHSERSEESSADLPSGWEWKKLGDLFKMVRGPFGGSLKKECFKKEGHPVYEQQNAIYSKFEFRYFIDDKKFEEMSRFRVEPGDFIMSCSGTMGKVAIVPPESSVGIINQALLKMSPQKGIISTYAKYYMMNSSFVDSLLKNAQGVAIKNVAAVKELKLIPFALPPLSVQKEIVSRLDKLSENVKRLEANYKQIIANCDELKKSILKKTFEGES